MRPKKIILFVSLFVLISACGNSGSLQKQENQPNEEQTSEEVSLKTYKNSKYDIGLQLPKNWIVIERKDNQMGNYTVNIFKKEAGALANAILGVHTSTQYSYIAIWPEGLATELPFSQYALFEAMENSLNLNFDVNRVESKLLVLKDGSVWAYFLRPENVPENWSGYGFIYAQVQIMDHKTICYDEQTGEKIPVKQCDFLEGDEIVQTGRLNQNEAAAIRSMLETISLKKVKEKVTVGDLIEVEQPLPNTTITSPLTVKGKARGMWFFEGSFAIKLYDASGDLLATGIATAQENWMTEDFVPFKATLEFADAPDDERGRLVFIKANPSGKPKFDKSYSIPVIFPQK